MHLSHKRLNLALSVIISLLVMSFASTACITPADVPAIATTTPIPTAPPPTYIALSPLPPTFTPTPPPVPVAPPASTVQPRPGNPPNLVDFWEGRARWELDVPDTGLPIGESDTISLGDGVYWSYLHASYQSAEIIDFCGEPVEFPGCVTRWVSTDGGRHFELSAKQCLFECNTCPCGPEDHPWQQQYPRVVAVPGGGYYMVYEQGASAWIAYSYDGLDWYRAHLVPGTGIWTEDRRACEEAERIGPHPAFVHEMDCMAGGPPGVAIAEGRIYVFIGLGQNPGHMGCYWSALNDTFTFTPCESNPLFDGANEYGPLDVFGVDAHPYFDFRFVTSADVVRVEGMYYMAYEGIRGPSTPTLGRDDQFALGLARSLVLNGHWEKYPGNPILDGMIDNWGIGHADILTVDGVTYMYTGRPGDLRGRYVLVYK